MKTKSRLTILYLVFVLALCLGIVRGAAGFVEDFDNAQSGAIPAGWEGKGDLKATCAVVDKSVIVPHSPPYCLKMADDSPSTAVQFSKGFGDLAMGTIRFAAYIPSAFPADMFCTFTKSGEKIFDMTLSPAGNVKYRNQAGSLQEAAKYTQDAWHVVAISWDCGTGQFSLAVDGNTIGEYPLIKNAVPDMIELKVGSGSKVGQVGYLDSVELIDDAHLQVGGLAVLAR